MNFHEPCDWHPPLYYFLASTLLWLFGSQWSVYLAQLVLSFLSVLLVYKISRLYFSEKISFIVAFILSIEPFWGWYTFLLTSENLSIPLFLAGLYFIFRFFKAEFRKEGKFRYVDKNILYSAFFLGLATLTRPNTLLLPFSLAVLMILLFIFKKPLKLVDNLPRLNTKEAFIYPAVFIFIFILTLAPWFIRNKIIYDRFTLANITSTNIYFYNLPIFLVIQKNISYTEAFKLINNKADKDLGENVGDQGNCKLLTQEEFNKQLDYFEKEAKEFIFANFFPYLKMHLIKAIPFFLQPGNLDMYSAYTGEYSKPDITGAFMKGDLSGVKKFFSEINLKLILYLLEMTFWGICSLAVFFGFVYSYFKDKRKFVFMLIGLAVIIYNALLLSPFIVPRYRLPVYGLFFIPLVYMAGVAVKYIKAKGCK